MRFKHSLRTRVASAFAALGGGIALVIAIGLYVGAQDAGVHMLDETLNAEMQDYQARRLRNPHSLPPTTATLLGYVTPSAPGEPVLPPELIGQTPGSRHIRLDGIPYRLAVADHQDHRYYLLYNETLLHEREAKLGVYLAAAVILMTLLSAGIALWLTERVIEPVKALAQRLRGITPETPHADLAADFPADELGELAQAFEQSLDRLAAFIERERAFTSDVSHELRTPLAVIGGAAEVLLADESRPERERLRLQRIVRSVTDMTDLTTALLTLAREHDADTKTQADIATLLHDSLEKHRHLLANRPVNVVLDIQATPSLVADLNLLSIVLANLVRNSFTYTERGEVRVTLAADHLRIADTGLGIPRAALGQVFQRLYKGQQSQGAGIGLSLVKRICDRYGWQIDLESEEGRGTTALLTFVQPDLTPR